MTDKGGSKGGSDPFQLSRFLDAQDEIYDRVLAELKSGRKRSHWMWFVFPQIEWLGASSTTQYYSIKRLRECAETILALEGLSASSIFGYPDDLKLKSSMTLFAAVAEGQSVFSRVLEKYYQGNPDQRTLAILERLKD